MFSLARTSPARNNGSSGTMPAVALAKPALLNGGRLPALVCSAPPVMARSAVARAASEP